MNQQEFKIFVTQRWDQFKTGSLEETMNVWMKETAKARSTDSLIAYPVVDNISTHQITDGNTMVVVVYRVEYEEIQGGKKQPNVEIG